MKSKKVHLGVKCSADAVCNTITENIVETIFLEFYNLPKEKQCKSCLKTKYYQEQEQKMESERKASCEELGCEVVKDVKPPKYNPKDVAFKETKQESKHYKNGLETIKKIKSTLDNLEGEITLFQAYCMGNIIKYEDRAGLKDDKDKDLYKASDYTAMMINNNWIGKD